MTARRTSRLALRNRDAILAALRRVLPARGTVLELGSGTGEHALHLAAALPGLTWQPSDPDPAARESIAAWAAGARLSNLLPPLDLDLRLPISWCRQAEAILVVNVLHVAPAGSAEALVRGAARVLPPGGPLVVVGPIRRDDVPSQPPAAELERLASAEGLRLEESVELEEGQALLVFRRA